MHPQWAREIRDQCIAADVPFFFKQWGAWAPAPWRIDRAPDEPEAVYKARAEKVGATHAYAAWAHEHDHFVIEPDHRPWSAERTTLNEREHAPIRRFGMKGGGRELDGREWLEFPESPECALHGREEALVNGSAAAVADRTTETVR